MNYILRGKRDRTKTALVQVLLNRGISENDIYHFLNTTDSDLIDPCLIEHVDEGAQMLLKHIENGDKIFIQPDADVDGFTSAAILINYLYKIYPDFVKNNIFYEVHNNKEHGIDLDFINDDIKLVIAPDSSSNEFDIHKILYDKGIDVLVIDHHNAEGYSPWACVINNQISNYPNKDLSGAGMVYKFCCYLDKFLDINFADDFLDLAIFGIIADVMPLTNFETRRMITKALDIGFKNTFLDMLASQNSFQSGVELIPKTFSWTMAPAVNAICRVGSRDDKLIVFKAMLDMYANKEIPSTKRGHKDEMETVAEQAVRVAKNVKAGQDRSRDRLSADFDAIIEEKNLLQNKILALKMPNSTQDDRNITGLVANKLMSKYQRPVLVLSKRVLEDGSVHWAGSGRNGGDGLENFQKFLNDSGLVDWANGHSNAFGVSIPDENFAKLIEYSNQKLSDLDFTPKYKIDIIYYGNNIDLNDIASIADNNNLWGEGIEEPKIMIKDLVIRPGSCSISSRGYFKIDMGSELSIVKMRMSDDEYNQIAFNKNVKLDIIGTCIRNIGYGDGLQIRIEDYDINISDWYF